jgi:hypothetical protein
MTEKDSAEQLQHRTALLQRWEAAKKTAESVKPIIEEERKLRKMVQDEFFPEPKEGVNRVDLNAGWQLKLSWDVKRSFDAEKILQVMEELSASGEESWVEDVITFKPNLVLSGYQMLMLNAPDHVRNAVNSAVIVKTAVKDLTIKAPKGIS